MLHVETASREERDHISLSCGVQDRWRQRKLDAIQYKGGKCQVCGYSKYYGALEFHHRNPEEKEFAWQKMRLVSKDRLTAELDKCDLLCANCHREIHQTGD